MSHSGLKSSPTLFLLYTLLFGANASADNDLQFLTITDWHVHVAGLGYGDSNNFINQQMRDNFRFRFFLKWMDVSLKELTEHGDQLVVKRLNEKIEQSQYIDQAVILALDGVIDTNSGQLDRNRTQFYVDNDFVASQTAKYPKLIFGASINPARHDSIERLEQAHKQGAVLVKWIPSIMHLDPANEKYMAFYHKMAELDLILLSHTGVEKSFPEANDELADPRRLELALNAGVTVIAAHIATTGESAGQGNFERILPMFAEYPNLYTDISSLTQINKLGYLARVINESGLQNRMIYGSDWPLQYFPLVSPWYHWRHIGLRQAWQLRKVKNEWDRDILLKQAFGLDDAVFSRQLGRLNTATDRSSK